MEDLADAAGVSLPEVEWDTVGGLVLGLAERIPDEGEQFDFGPLRFTVTSMQGRRVSKVMVTTSKLSTRDEVGFRPGGRPAQRREVDAGQQTGRLEGVDHLVTTPDHTERDSELSTGPIRRTQIIKSFCSTLPACTNRRPISATGSTRWSMGRWARPTWSCS